MPRSVVTQLMFDGQAEEAMTVYVSLFGGSVTGMQKYGPGERGREGTVKRAEFTVGGHRLACIDSSVRHAFTFTPSASLFVEVADEVEFDRAFVTLSEGGAVMMPPGGYGFSRKFAWLNDRFGVSWQLNLASEASVTETPTDAAPPRQSPRASDLSAALSTERVLAAGPRTVFAAFERPDQLARWWGPNGFTNTFERFEFTPGGRWVFVMHGPDGTDYPNESVFRLIQPDTRVVIEHVSHPRFTLTVSLSARGGQTHLTWVQEFESAELAAR